jgi:hypothetical protein
VANVALRILAEARQAIGEVSHLRAVEGQLAETTAAAAKAMAEQAVSQTRVAETAHATVASAVQQREAIRANLAEYGALAAAAKKGSDEQIVANRLAADSAAQLGLAYREAGVAAVTAARRSAAASRTSARESNLRADSQPAPAAPPRSAARPSLSVRWPGSPPTARSRRRTTSATPCC